MSQEVKQPVGWVIAREDIDGLLAFLADNLTVLLTLIALNLFVVKVPADIVFGRILPGATIGLLCANFYYSLMSKRLAEKEGRRDVTALPCGISIVFVLVYTFGILVPVSAMTGDPVLAWKVGMWATFLAGVVDALGAIIGPWLRANLPRAAMLGSLAGIAIVFIAGEGLVHIMSNPYVGFPAMAIIFWGLIARGRLPGRIPAGLAAIIVGIIIAAFLGKTTVNLSGVGFYYPFPWIVLDIGSFAKAFSFVGIILPIAFFTIIDTVNNVESAAAVGDRYSTREAMLTDGFATMIGAIFGSPYPNTVFIGHPGYKRLGSRMGYAPATALLMFLLAIFGLFQFVSGVIPIAAVMPLLIFIGLIMTDVAFGTVPRHHAIAVAFAMIPFVLELSFERVIQTITALGNKLTPDLISKLAAQGVDWAGTEPLGYGTLFISLLMGAVLVFLLDKDYLRGAMTAFGAAILSFFGIIYAPTMGVNQAPALAAVWALFGLLFLGLLAFKPATAVAPALDDPEKQD
ncbi:MAG: hypothetical protein M1136_09440 [Chloroflexi bacterium]|nr:hypothetical protein [Chloroflexota bacterium]MCL5075850.1 hypothetical protein [Chloroflexota bacterium]